MTDETNKDPGAEVIPFPGQFRPPVDDVEKLKQAIYFLNQAVAELHHRISDWRGVTNVLSVGIGEVAENLETLDTCLMAASSHPKGFG